MQGDFTPGEIQPMLGQIELNIGKLGKFGKTWKTQQISKFQFSKFPKFFEFSEFRDVQSDLTWVETHFM